MKIIQFEEFTDGVGKHRIFCDELVGKGANWIVPARVLDMEVADYLIMLKTNYNATLNFYKEEGKIKFVGCYWDHLEDLRNFKNFLNLTLRKKKVTLKSLGIE